MRLIEWTAPDGVRIVARLYEPTRPFGRPVVCLPGLTRNSRDFDSLAEVLAGHSERPRTVLAVDYRGRGLSGYAEPATYRPDVEAADVVTGLDSLGWIDPAVVGTSRGGIIAMLLAATQPKRAGPVVLNDIGPVIDLPGLVAIRERMDAMLTGDGPDGWDEIVAGLKVHMGPAFPALTEDDWQAFARQMYREDASGGRPVLDYDPALLSAFADFDPTVGVPPFWPIFAALAPRPVLTIRGETSDLLSEETLVAMQAAMPAMEIHRVAGEGHAPLLRDAATIERIRDFLERAEV